MTVPEHHITLPSCPGRPEWRHRQRVQHRLHLEFAVFNECDLIVGKRSSALMYTHFRLSMLSNVKLETVT